MESKRVQIKFLPSNKYNGIIIPYALCRELGIDDKKQMVVQLGQKRLMTRILKVQRADRAIWIPPAIRLNLAIPFDGDLHVKVTGDTLRLGPVVGILTVGISMTDNQLVSARSSFFKHLLSAQRGESIYYFLFTPSDVDWSTNTVRGMFLRGDANGLTWRRLTVPLPDVVYNRIPDRHSEKLLSVTNFIKRLEENTDAKMFNPTFFNKWSIHQRLVDHPLANRHIPETHVAPTVQKVDHMLKKYGMVYLKPVTGSLGLGILKLTYRPGIGYFCRYHSHSQNVVRRYRSLATLLQNHLPKSRFSNYLVQQGINLIKFKDRPLDFRVHAHKNRENQWVVAAIAAKIAGLGSVTTHVRTGGTVILGQDLLKQVFPQNSTYMEQQVKETAILLAKAIESRLNQNIGELGFDIGIDHKGHIWMFEANSRPGRSIFKASSLKDADSQSIRLIVDYSKFLANFN
ncbi:YheC/YheD family protein [Ammoniphilus resinae]|uniref:ATP-grasp domain-containing protein n=1 Tax=Ammoniphilus resinae TaxID=861532 RepID=A0ABS4GJ42_9BACL|nr:YheC/YheD family protein [Ammoniphilus resinae]MBP1930278.1 hypothetical protein [Ammoniphilus resinae]